MKNNQGLLPFLAKASTCYSRRRASAMDRHAAALQPKYMDTLSHLHALQILDLDRFAHSRDCDWPATDGPRPTRPVCFKHREFEGAHMNTAFDSMKTSVWGHQQ